MLTATSPLRQLHHTEAAQAAFSFFSFLIRKAVERIDDPYLGQGLTGIFDSLPQWTQPVGEAKQTKARQTWVRSPALPLMGHVTSSTRHYLICTARTELGSPRVFVRLGNEAQAQHSDPELTGTVAATAWSQRQTTRVWLPVLCDARQLQNFSALHFPHR